MLLKKINLINISTDIIKKKETDKQKTMNYFLELETRDVELIIELLKKNTMIPMEVSYPLYSKIMQSVENTNNEYKKQQLEKQQTIENEKLKQLENDDKETNKMKNEKRTIRMRNKKISKGSDNDLN